MLFGPASSRRTRGTGTPRSSTSSSKTTNRHADTRGTRRWLARRVPMQVRRMSCARASPPKSAKSKGGSKTHTESADPHRPCPPIGPMLLLISSRTPSAATSHGSCWSGTRKACPALLISPYRTWKRSVLKKQQPKRNNSQLLERAPSARRARQKVQLERAWAGAFTVDPYRRRCRDKRRRCRRPSGISSSRLSPSLFPPSNSHRPSFFLKRVFGSFVFWVAA